MQHADPLGWLPGWRSPHDMTLKALVTLSQERNSTVVAATANRLCRSVAVELLPCGISGVKSVRVTTQLRGPHSILRAGGFRARAVHPDRAL